MAEAPDYDKALETANQPAGAQTAAAGGQSDVQRGEPELSDQEKAFVGERIKAIRDDKQCWAYAFKRMRKDMRFANGKEQWPGQTEADERYMVNLTYRHIRNRVAAIYAKNPTPVAKPVAKLRYIIWDGKADSFMQAQAMLAGQMPANPAQTMWAQQVMMEAAQGQERLNMLKKVGRTGELLIQHFMREHSPSFKRGMKRVVRRGKTMGVGYVRLDYKRVTKQDPSIGEGLLDMKGRLERLEALQADVRDGETDPYSADIEELKQARDALLRRRDAVLREGLQFDFPFPMNVIPHAATMQLDGFVGGEWITIEHALSVQRVKEVYKIDLGKNFKPYRRTKDGSVKEAYVSESDGKSSPHYDKKCLALVWEHYHKPTGLIYTLCDGYPGYLTKPMEPVTDLERFWPIYAYVPNEMEDDEDIYPLSDTRLLYHVQKEYNRIRESLRQHRYANRPLYLARDIALPTSGEEDDPIKTLAEHRAHEIITLSGLDKNEDPAKVLRPMETVRIDPNMYETESVYSDSLRAVGSQQVDFGGTSGDTATEVAAARETRQVDDNDDIDALDMLLSDLFRDAFKVCLKETPASEVRRIVGPGAVWPQLSRQEIAEELDLEVLGGSTGKPDVAREIANFERLGNFVVQLPGLSPYKIAGKVVQWIDPSGDLGEWMAEGAPSIIQLNAMMKQQTAQPQGADMAREPAAQGPRGADNTLRGPQNNLGGQPAFPSGAPQLGRAR